MLTTIVAVALLGQVKGEHFWVNCENHDLAQKVLDKAHQYRREIAEEWLGKELGSWGYPNLIYVNEKMPQSGKNQDILFLFSILEVTGNEKDILYSALPHEVAHSVIRRHCGVLLPLWASEGIAMLCERVDEGGRSNQPLIDHVTDRPLRDLFERELYPLLFRETFYGQALSATSFLVEKKDKKTFVDFILDGKRSGWEGALKKYYGIENYSALDKEWQEWHVSRYGKIERITRLTSSK